jgi:23S rRNA (guanosine2251-2'-O)-methyltransferase
VHLAPDVSDDPFHQALKKANIPTQGMDLGEFERFLGFDANHQGIAALIDTEKLLIPFESFLDEVNPTHETAVAVLGEVQDPHNVGAIIRSAAAFGISAVLIPKHHQAQVTGTVVKTSAGMTFRITLISIGNVNDALQKLKDKGFWVYGLTMSGQPLSQEKFDTPAAFVFGNEGDGIREKTLEHCDIKLAIPMHPRCESLNVSVSAGIVFATWSTQHPNSLK